MQAQNILTSQSNPEQKEPCCRWYHTQFQVLLNTMTLAPKQTHSTGGPRSEAVVLQMSDY